jgi:hypothetical protein
MINAADEALGQLWNGCLAKMLKTISLAGVFGSSPRNHLRNFD